MSGISNAHSTRLLFWFLWLSGFALGFVLMGNFMAYSVFEGNVQKAVPYFMGFTWQCCVQLAALKSYQQASRLREPLLIQLIGSLVLVVGVLVLALIG